MTTYYELYNDISKLLSAYQTVGKLVNRINEGAIQGFEEITTNRMAAVYAINALEGQEITDNGLETHLGFLEEDGAHFDYMEAMDEADNMIRAIEGE